MARTRWIDSWKTSELKKNLRGERSVRFGRSCHVCRVARRAWCRCSGWFLHEGGFGEINMTNKPNFLDVYYDLIRLHGKERADLCYGVDSESQLNSLRFRCLSGQKYGDALQGFIQILFVCSSSPSVAPHTGFIRYVQIQQIEGNTTLEHKVFEDIVLPNSTTVLIERRVQSPMLFVLDTPMVLNAFCQ